MIASSVDSGPQEPLFQPRNHLVKHLSPLAGRLLLEDQPVVEAIVNGVDPVVAVLGTGRPRLLVVRTKQGEDLERLVLPKLVGVVVEVLHGPTIFLEPCVALADGGGLFVEIAEDGDQLRVLFASGLEPVGDEGPRLREAGLPPISSRADRASF